MTDWTGLGRRLGIDQLEAFVRAEMQPHLEALPGDLPTGKRDPAIARLQAGLTASFFAFAIGFFFFAVFLPDTVWGVVLRFVVFPLGFFGMLALGLWLNRDAVGQLILKGEERLVARSAAMDALADRLGLEYVPTPGGAPATLKKLAELGFLKAQTSRIVEILERHGGMEEAVRIARMSGLIGDNVVVFGTPEQRKEVLTQAANDSTFEDGLIGVRQGIRFQALEWVEKVDEAPDRFHLLLVLTSPVRLHGTTQLRSRKTAWPAHADVGDMADVHLVPEDFNERFRLRGTDQVEARTLFNPAVVERVLKLAHGDHFRAVADGDYLVFDIVGANRFNLVELTTGQWSDETIARTLTDLAELLELVDALAHAFMVRA